jgi:hypothetical protein
MKNVKYLVLGIALLSVAGFALAGPSGPDNGGVQMYYDAAPNAYGSPLYAPWWSQTEAAVAGGTFTNLGNGAYPGTTNVDPYDFMVYSAGDLGKRLTWIYWIPNTTVAQLSQENFQVKLAINWGGTDYALNWDTDGWDDNGPNVDWVTPSSWENYDGGVIGSIGLAFWPVGSDGVAADVTQADIDAYREMLLEGMTSATGSVSLDGNVTSQTLNVVPVPAAVLLGIGGLSLVGLLKKRFAKSA